MKRTFSFIITLSMLLSMVPLFAFADAGDHSFDGTSKTFGFSYEGVGLSGTYTVCSDCGKYARYDVTCGFTTETVYDVFPINYESLASKLAIQDWGVDDCDGDGNNDTLVVPAYPSGVGRKDILGYTSPGVPNYDNSGNLQLVVYPEYFRVDSGDVYSSSERPYPSTFSYSAGFGSIYVSGLDFTVRGSSTKNNYFRIYSNYSFTAPVTGLYLVNSKQTYSSGSYYSDGVKGSRSVDALALNKHLGAGSSSSIPISNPNYAYVYTTSVSDRTNIPTTYLSLIHI